LLEARSYANKVAEKTGQSSSEAETRDFGRGKRKPKRKKGESSADESGTSSEGEESDSAESQAAESESPKRK